MVSSVARSRGIGFEWQMVPKVAALMFSATLMFSGCTEDSTEETAGGEKEMPVQNMSKLRVLHASSDAPKVNVYLDGAKALSGVDFMQGSGLIDVISGEHSIEVKGILPDESEVSVIGPVDVSLVADTQYDVVALGAVSDIEPKIVEAPVKTVDAGKARVQVIHGASSAPEVDVYVTGVDANLSTSSPLGTFAFKGVLGPVEIDSGTYQIRVTPKGSKTVVFDSGSIALAGDLSVVAVNNTQNGASPINLVALDGTTAGVIQDVNMPAAFRVGHVSPDAPEVDIVINDDFANPVLEDVPYPAVSNYLEVPEATYNAKVAVANTQTVVIDANLSLEKAQKYSVYAVNTVSNIEPLVLNDTTRRVATATQIRLLHGAPSAPNVDIYVTAVDANISSLTPNFTDVPFKAETGFVALTPGSYQVRIAVAGTKTVVLDTGALTLDGGGIYTAIAREQSGGGLPLGLILLDDFVSNN